MKQLYLRIVLLTFLLSVPAVFFAQGFGLPPGFELKKFQQNEEQALYFIQYDSAFQRVAAFDPSAQGKSYVCYQDKKTWKVVTGTLDSSGFKDASFFIIDSKNLVTLSKKKFDTLLVSGMGRALYNSGIALTKSNIKASAWKKFLKVNADQSIAVWAFPDADAAGNIWYGPECSWYYTPDGRNLNTSKLVNKAPMTAGKSNGVLNFSCPAEKMPTIGLIWLAHKYKLAYPEINIAYKAGVSTLHYNVAERTYAWDHTAN